MAGRIKNHESTGQTTHGHGQNLEIHVIENQVKTKVIQHTEKG